MIVVRATVFYFFFPLPWPLSQRNIHRPQKVQKGWSLHSGRSWKFTLGSAINIHNGTALSARLCGFQKGI